MAAVVRWLIITVTVAPTEKIPSRALPGAPTVIVARMTPASPAGVISSASVPPLITTSPSPRFSPTPLAAMRSTRTSSAVPATPSTPLAVCCSNENEAASRRCPAISRNAGSPPMPVSLTRRYGPAGRSSVIVSSPSWNESVTAAPVWLISSVTVPPSATAPPRLARIETASLPARPAGLMTNAPWPSKISMASPPRLRLTLLARMAIAVTSPPGCPGVVSVVTRSKAKSPDRATPATPRVTPMPSTRRYGPAGRSIVSGTPPTVIESLTAPLVVLIWSPNEPLNVTPGMLRATSAEMVPASPPVPGTVVPGVGPASAGSMRMTPLPFDKVTTPPRSRPTWLMPMRTMEAPDAVEERSSTKFPDTVSPSTLSVAGVPGVVPVTSTRRNGPAGTSICCGTPPTSIVRRIAVVALLRTSSMRPENEMAGWRSMTRLADSRPAIPAGAMTSTPLIWSTVTTPPSDSEPSATPSVRIRSPLASVICSNVTSVCSVWPAMVSVTSSPAMRRYGPGAMSSARVVVPSVKVSWTRRPVVLMTSSNVPDSPTGAGRLSCRVPPILPASPPRVAGVVPVPGTMTKNAEPPLSVR